MSEKKLDGVTHDISDLGGWPPGAECTEKLIGIEDFKPSTAYSLIDYRSSLEVVA